MHLLENKAYNSKTIFMSVQKIITAFKASFYKKPKLYKKFYFIKKTYMKIFLCLRLLETLQQMV